MSATITLPTILRPYADGSKTIEGRGSTIGEVFLDVATRFPQLGEQLVADGRLTTYINVFLDDEDIRYLGGLEAAVGDRSEITVLPAVAGGGGAAAR